MFGLRLSFSRRRRYRQWIGLAVFGIAFFADDGTAAARHAVRRIRIEAFGEFPEATAPDALGYACADDRRQLEEFFVARHLKFEARLVHRRQRFGFCHIHYEPTLPGFRAAPEAGRVSRLFGDVDPMSFVARRKPIGDSLDIIKAVLSRMTRPVPVTLSLREEFEAQYWKEATSFHFPFTRHTITIQASAATVAHPWAQDYIKAGSCNGELRILLPRLLYEGRTATGAASRPFLDGFRTGTFVRSKLSWEGGDLQFVVDPKNPSIHILFYGAMARHYWGRSLSPGEYEYVLRTEFGAARAIDLSQFGPHVDFLVAFLPTERKALFALPVRGDFGVASAAAAELLRLYGERAPRELQQLAEYFHRNPDDPNWDMDRPLRLIGKLQRELPAIPAARDTNLQSALAAYVDRHCPADIAACSSVAGRKTMIRAAPDLLRRALDAAADYEFEATMTPRLLGLIQSQLPNAAVPDWELFEAKEREIRKLGFQVIRVPYLVAPHMMAEWPGISYANVLTIEHTVFVPAFGLGKAENRIFAELQTKLGGGYQVVPVFARFSLLHNAGVHCVFGIVRDSGLAADPTS
jgi:hypothetical protein